MGSSWEKGPLNDPSYIHVGLPWCFITHHTSYYLGQDKDKVNETFVQ